MVRHTTRVRRSGRLLTLGVAAFLPPVMGAWAVVRTGALTGTPCGVSDPPLHGPLPRLFVLGAIVAFFVAGHFFSYTRDTSNEPAARMVPRGAEAILPVRRQSADVLIHVLLAGFLLLVALLLLYEAVSLWRYPALWPITSYVRCVNSIAPWQTLAVSCAVSFLVGHWFWHRSEVSS